MQKIISLHHKLESMFSHSEENYLKAIYHLGITSVNGVSTNAIAKKLSTKASSVTDMIKKLSDKELIEYKKYKGTKLTKEGFLIAVRIVRKHRLWEVFLVDKLRFKWDEVHEIAEQLEHIQSVELTKRLDDFLDNPKVDPHGDPIPNENGELHFIESISLSELKKGAEAEIVGVVHSESSFLRFLEKNELMLGVKVKLEERFEFDGSIEVVSKGRILNLSEKVAKNIRVNRIN